jgi:hypothetical protein
MARDLGEAMVDAARSRVAVRTGRTRGSIRLGRVNEDGADVVGSAVAVILDRGFKAHTIRAHGSALRFSQGGRTIFARQADKPPKAGTNFLRAALRDVPRRVKAEDKIVDAWNRAA